MRYVFVCMGNTCRSPMAEALMNEAIKRRGIADAYAVSCGVMAYEGAQANECAKETMRNHGLDIEMHSASGISSSVVKGAVVLCMENRLTEYVKRMFPDADVHSLCEYASVPGAVEDPYGCGLNAYEKCAQKLIECIENILDRREKTK